MPGFVNNFLNWEYALVTLRALPTGLLHFSELLFFGYFFALVVGLIAALMVLRGFFLLRWLGVIYVDLFRSLPLLILIFFIYFGLPYAGITIESGVFAGVLALTICYGAYIAEVFRAGLRAVPKEQVEGAQSLGLTEAQVLRYVIIPQAIRIVVPDLTNQFVAMIKDTALVSVIGVAELLFEARSVAQATFNTTPYVVVGIVYIIITIPLIRLTDFLDEQMRKKRD